MTESEPEPTTSGPVDISAAIERLRLRLLDHGGRNRLLNFRHTKKNSVRLVDEVPDVLYSELVEGNDFVVAALPMSRRQAEIKFASRSEENELFDSGLGRKLDATELALKAAAASDIATDFELPRSVSRGNRRHTDKNLQTLLFPEDLGVLLRKVSSEAELAVQETGSNMLHLALGFLEWFESDASTTPRLAPLVLLPVLLERGDVDPRTREFQYRLQHSGEDPETNLSLRERLKKDFALELPELKADSSLSDYFAEVEELCASRNRWKVRTFATVALFSFGKILMYRDLADDRWPASSKPSKHARVRELLSGVDNEEGDDWAEEYDVDHPSVKLHLPPTVDEADGSQQSALVDVLKGRNLVIQGPPGTGKSQTIANLIAAAMQRGKTVLFVSEKLAALEVVRHRLNKVGLGDFCLELHSHKTKKRQLLDDIQERLARRRRRFDEARFAEAKRQLDAKKKELREYSDLLHRDLEPLGTTLFDALWRVEGLRAQLGEASGLLDAITFLHPERLTQADLRDYRERAEHFVSKLADVLVEGASMREHPWWGIGEASLTFLDLREVQEQVQALGESARELERLSAAMRAILGDEPRLSCGIELRRLVSAMVALPNSSSRTAQDLVATVLRASNVATAKNYLGAFERAVQAAAMTLEVVERLDAVDEEILQSLGRFASTLRDLPAEIPLSELAVAAARWSESSSRLRNGVEALRDASEALGVEVGVAESGFEMVSTVLQVLQATPFEYLELRKPEMRMRGTDIWLAAAAKRLAEFRAQQARLATSYDLAGLPVLSDLRGHFRAAAGASWWETFRARQRAAKRLVRELSAGQVRPGLRQAATELRSLVQHSEELEWLSGDARLKALGLSGREANEGTFAATQSLVNWYVGAEQLLSKYGDAGREILERVWSADSAWLSSTRERLASNHAIASKARESVSVLRADVLARGWCDGVDGWLTLHDLASTRSTTWKEAANEVTALTLRPGLGFGALARALALGSSYLSARAGLMPFDGFESVRAQSGAGERDWHRVCSIAIDYVGTLESVDGLSAAMRGVISSFGWESERELRRLASAASAELARFDTAVSALSERLAVDREGWFAAPSGDIQESQFEVIAASAARAAASDSLVAWTDFIRARNRFALAGLDGLASLAETGELWPAALPAAAEYVLMRSRVRAAFSISPELAALSELSREQLRRQFAELDVKIQELARAAAAEAACARPVPDGRSVGRVGDLTELALLEHELAKQRRHVPLRQLMRRAGRAIVGLKPCFMMGPLSVAQYLAPGSLSFDLVVMDEASQLKTEDALGAILRGQQLVVVGDRMQLPPTSFFDKAGDDSSEVPDEEADLAVGAESILEAAVAVYRPSRMLRWHYRSRHANLIAFSNAKFYGGRLIALPPTAPHDPATGVKLVEVLDGCYDSGTNVPEARKVVRAVVDLIRTRPGESIGVAAMNAAQAEVIGELFEQEMKRSEAVRHYVEAQAAGLEPFFVKNLENVQGDERDIILVSATYGRNVDGRVFQRFGPINGPFGHRRLNVLFTRARRRLVVFASMAAEDVIVGLDASPGVLALRDYLDFARTGRLAGNLLTGRAPDSDFEIAVARAIEASGYEVSAQVGAAGYYIDLAVRSRRHPDRFLLAVECDGQTYHSTRSARDRDRLRQQILEDLGWRVHRIWSTDWFRRPDHELQRVLREVELAEREEEERDARWTPEMQEEESLKSPGDAVEPFAVAVRIEDETPRMSDEEAQGQLVALRDRVRESTPPVEANLEFLRDEMIQALLRHRPITREEFLGRVPFDLRIDTDPGQMNAALEEALDVLRRLRRR